MTSTPTSTPRRSGVLAKLTVPLGLIALLLIGLIAVPLFSSSVNTPSNLVAIQVGGGPIEDRDLKRCIPPGTHEMFNSPGDDYVYFPLSQRDWDATGQDGSDTAAYRSVSKDNIEMTVPVTVRFSMVTDCKTLKEWYVEHGQRYGASLTEDGVMTPGWNLALRKLVGDPLDAQLDRIVQKYEWKNVWNDPAVKAELEKEVSAQLEALVDRQARGHFFEDFTVLIKKPSPVDEALVEAINDQQKQLAVSQQAIARAKADVAKARAEVRVAKAEAAKRRAQVRGYGSTEAYLKAQAIEKGINPWQPTGTSVITPD